MTANPYNGMQEPFHIDIGTNDSTTHFQTTFREIYEAKVKNVFQTECYY